MTRATRRDATALVLLVLSAGGAAVLAFAVQAALARAWDVEAYGHFSTALAVVTIAAPAIGFGIPAFWLRAYGVEGARAARWVPASLHFICISAVVTAAAVAAWASVGVREHDTAHLLLWMLPALLGQSAVELCGARCQLEGRFARVSAWQLAQHAARFVVAVLAVRLHAGTTFVAIAFGAIAVGMTVGAWRSMRVLRNGHAVLDGHGDGTDAGGPAEPVPGVAQVARQALPFGVASLLYFAYAQGGLIVAAVMLGPRDAGTYNVVVTTLAAVYLLPAVLFQKLLMPRLHRWAVTDPARLRHAFHVGNRWMVLAGLAVGVALVVVAPAVVPFAFGERYRDAVLLVQWMAVCAPLRFVTTSASSVMTTRDFIVLRNRCAFVALAVGIGLGVGLMPGWGLPGAVAAAIAGEVLWCALAWATGRRCVAAVSSGHVPDGCADARAATRGVSAAAAARAGADRPPVAPVSVIVPCHRSVATLERAVASVYAQTWRPAELILVDDASPDDTLACIESLRTRYGGDWIRVIALSRNGGPGVARNVGWLFATQRFVAFLDADDTWHRDKIARQCGWMEAWPEAAITGHPVQQLPEGAALPADRAPHRAPVPVSRRAVLFSNRFTPSSVMVRADVAARFDERKRHAEDYFMLLQLVLVERGAAYLFDMPLSHVYKAQFGVGGLSGQLWKIQQGEQHNYRHFRRVGAIGVGEWCVHAALSFAKYLRRCALSGRFA
ncbi:glycosyltransferase [Burkholderia sp. Bp8992]|uniref:glycosyltransferase n=1 Tax=Burkholderia sp. Bp8992 TaxID=2184554 RepID=UPI000F5605F9|nr:glycosyltransferase [Burkholderia sp. Bp8992]RQS19257.1 glycosyltransferase [Burkholderia sp. Bp8992]